MSLTFIPSNGATIAFGSVVENTTASSTIEVKCHSTTGAIDNVVSVVFTGINAAQFTLGDWGGYIGFISDGDDQFASIVFTPNGTGAFSATATVNYKLNTGGGPGGTPGSISYSLTGMGISNPAPPANPNEVTSLLTSARYLLVPTQGTTGKVLSFYDTTNLNDATDSSTYVFKAEDIHADRVPTVRSVYVTYVDLGVATIVVSVSGYNDNGVLTQGQATITIGTAEASGAILTTPAYLSVTSFRPQIKITRAANAGPVQIVHVLASGTIETGVTL